MGRMWAYAQRAPEGRTAGALSASHLPLAKCKHEALVAVVCLGDRSDMPDGITFCIQCTSSRGVGCPVSPAACLLFGPGLARHCLKHLSLSLKCRVSSNSTWHCRLGRNAGTGQQLHCPDASPVDPLVVSKRQVAGVSRFTSVHTSRAPDGPEKLGQSPCRTPRVLISHHERSCCRRDDRQWMSACSTADHIRG